MDLELVTIGTELLLGHTINTNAADCCRALASVGARVTRTTTTGDDPDAIRSTIEDALRRSGFVIATGGLGPTRDDVTKQAVAALFGVPIVMNAAYERHLEDWMRRLGRPGPMSEANRTQALMPEGAEILPNPRGTAPGLWLDGPPGTVVMLPGVPQEMRGLMYEAVCPRIAQRGGAESVTRSRVLRTTGIAESVLADRLEGIEERLAPVTLAYLPTFDGVDLRLTAWAVNASRAAALLDSAAETLRPLLGAYCYGEEDADLAGVLLDALGRDGLRLAVAESCTGGLIAARLTAVPGASAVFTGGVIAYGNEVKTRDLGVPESLLRAEGAVSEPVVLAMVRGLVERFGVGAGVAVSGIAGPSGGTAEKPVGTVCIAARLREAERTVAIRIPGDREAIRARSAQRALFMLKRLMDGKETTPAGGGAAGA